MITEKETTLSFVSKQRGNFHNTPIGDAGIPRIGEDIILKGQEWTVHKVIRDYEQSRIMVYVEKYVQKTEWFS